MRGMVSTFGGPRQQKSPGAPVGIHLSLYRNEELGGALHLVDDAQRVGGKSFQKPLRIGSHSGQHAGIIEGGIAPRGGGLRRQRAVWERPEALRRLAGRGSTFQPGAGPTGAQPACRRGQPAGAWLFRAGKCGSFR